MPKPIDIPKIYKQWWKDYGLRTSALWTSYRCQCFVCYFFEKILCYNEAKREAFTRGELAELQDQAYDYAYQQLA